MKGNVIYETVAQNGSKYSFVDTGSWIVVYVNGKEWGSPQGDRFLRAVINDINALKEKMKQDSL